MMSKAPPPNRRPAPGAAQANTAARMLFAALGTRDGLAIHRRLSREWMLIPADVDPMAWHWPVRGLDIWLLVTGSTGDEIDAKHERAIAALLRDGAASVQPYRRIEPSGAALFSPRIGHDAAREMGIGA